MSWLQEALRDPTTSMTSMKRLIALGFALVIAYEGLSARILMFVYAFKGLEKTTQVDHVLIVELVGGIIGLLITAAYTQVKKGEDVQVRS